MRRGVVKGEPDREGGPPSFGDLAIPEAGQCNMSSGKDGSSPRVVNGSLKDGGAFRDLDDPGNGCGTIVSDFEAEVPGEPGDRFDTAGLNLDRGASPDVLCADESAPEPVAVRAMGDAPPGVGRTGRGTGWPRPPTSADAWPARGDTVVASAS